MRVEQRPIIENEVSFEGYNASCYSVEDLSWTEVRGVLDEALRYPSADAFLIFKHSQVPIIKPSSGDAEYVWSCGEAGVVPYSALIISADEENRKWVFDRTLTRGVEKRNLDPREELFLKGEGGYPAEIRVDLEWGQGIDFSDSGLLDFIKELGYDLHLGHMFLTSSGSSALSLTGDEAVLTIRSDAPKKEVKRYTKWFQEAFSKVAAKTLRELK